MTDSNSSKEIPKVIHYCWFGKNHLPNKAKKCIASWKKYFPEYKIKEWNEDNFDVNCCDYVKEAYQSKKWAFVSDYARFWILYNFGGLYFDTDVEIIKPIDEIVSRGAFMGYEAYCNIEALNPEGVYQIAPGLGLGAEKGMNFYKKVLDYYEGIHLLDKKQDGAPLTVVEIVTMLLKQDGLCMDGKYTEFEGISFYPEDYFCPFNFSDGKLRITNRTVSIHHYDSSWQSKDKRFKNKLKQFLGSRIVSVIIKLKNRIRK